VSPISRNTCSTSPPVLPTTRNPGHAHLHWMASAAQAPTSIYVRNRI
jgi:hypothetical protein